MIISDMVPLSAPNTWRQANSTPTHQTPKLTLNALVKLGYDQPPSQKEDA